jgi:hypothetical protein
MAKKNRVFVGLQGEKLGIESGKKGDKYCQGEPLKIEVEERVQPAKLISRLDYPEEVAYGTDSIRISPRSRTIVADMSKLGKLPKGIIAKEIKK